MVSTDARFARNHEVVTRKIDGELIIVPIRSGVGDLNSLYTLNPVGAVLWDFINEGHSVSDMVEKVCDEFDVTAAQATRDIEAFLDSLLAERLIESVA